MTVKPPASTVRPPGYYTKPWNRISSHGKRPAFPTPDDLWNAACEYFEYIDQHPLYEAKSYSYQGDVHQDSLAKMRAMTLDGLQLFLHITQTTWYNYKKKDDFKDTTGRIEQVIRSQKFEGAAAGLLNPNIIARDLGLVDSTETKLKGALGISDLTELSDDDLNRKLLQLEQKLEQSVRD